MRLGRWYYPVFFFSSLTVYPLFSLAKQLFSEKVATLTAILYLINPLCWLQAERPTSDAMGLFFVTLSADFLYRAFNPMLTNSNSKYCLFWGGLALGLGLGVRLSNFPFIVLLIGILFYLAVQRMNLKTQVILYGFMGLVAGIFFLAFPTNRIHRLSFFFSKWPFIFLWTFYRLGWLDIHLLWIKADRLSYEVNMGVWAGWLVV